MDSARTSLGRYLMDVWFTTGVVPGMDVGVSFDPLGARLDAYLKHKLYKDYLSLSYELQSGLWTTTIGRDFALQLSLLAGYPGKVFAPYGIVRQRLFFLGVDGIQTGSALLLVAGLRITRCRDCISSWARAWASTRPRRGILQNRTYSHSPGSARALLSISTLRRFLPRS